MKIFSTKELDPHIIEMAAQAGFSVHCKNLISVNEVEWTPDRTILDNFDALAFTSEKAVRIFCERPEVRDFLQSKKIFALSGKTTKALEELGFAPQLRADNAAFLAEQIIANKAAKSVLHICGRMRLDYLDTLLMKAGINYQACEVYETILKTDFQLPEDYDVILFYSPSAVKSFFTSHRLNAENPAVCIGPSTAEALKFMAPEAKILIPEHPSQEAMIKLLIEKFK